MGLLMLGRLPPPVAPVRDRGRAPLREPSRVDVRGHPRAGTARRLVLPFSVADLLVPGIAPYRPVATALGIVAMELLAALALRTCCARGPPTASGAHALPQLCGMAARPRAWHHGRGGQRHGVGAHSLRPLCGHDRGPHSMAGALDVIGRSLGDPVRNATRRFCSGRPRDFLELAVVG